MRAPVPGEPAPPLALATVDGQPFDLRGLRERPVLASLLRHAG